MDFFEDLEGIAAATKTKTALVDTQERLGMILDLMPIGFLIHQRMGILFANQASSDFLDTSQKTLIGQHLLDFLDGDELAKVEDLFDKVFNSDTPHQIPELRIKLDGHASRTYRLTSARLPWEGTPACQILLQDITRETQKARQLEVLLATDALTGAQNRRSFVKYVEEFCQTKTPDQSAMIFLDVDHFKSINDTYGHEAGDLVLKHLAIRCDHILARELVTLGTHQKPAMLARMGGEEFAIFIPSSDAIHAADLAERLRQTIACTPIDVPGASIEITASFGFTNFDCSTRTVDEMLAEADMALYQAKKEGRNRVLSYTGETAGKGMKAAGISRKERRRKKA